MSTLVHPVEITVVQKSRKGEKVDNFADAIKPICTLQSTAELSYFLHHLCPLSAMSVMDINIFKVGIKAMWEDEENINGGKYILRLKKEVGQRVFEKILVHFCAQAFRKININGIVLSVRPKHFILGIWTRNCPSPEEWAEDIEEIKQALGIDFYILVEFKKNDESLRDNSSFRNALLHS